MADSLILLFNSKVKVLATTPAICCRNSSRIFERDLFDNSHLIRGIQQKGKEKLATLVTNITQKLCTQRNFNSKGRKRRKRREANIHNQQQKKLVVSYNNVNGLSRDVQLALQSYADYSFHNIFALVETRVKEGDIAYTPVGCSSHHVCRTSGVKKGGGIAFFATDSNAYHRAFPSSQKNLGQKEIGWFKP